MDTGMLVTFYSYKGGVGRTFTLANVGVALASWGYRILCIDWDLDAPGLDYYFRVDKSQPGLVELVTAFGHDKNPDWHDYVSPVTVGDGISLDLMCAGQRNESFIDHVQELDWVELYEKKQLAESLEEWRLEWKKSYDFVLIDSRTGVTDIGALCTAHLPDILVALFMANRQSLEGCIEVIERSKRARQSTPFERAALPVLPVPSRIDTREELESVLEWKRKFEDRLGAYYGAWADQGIQSMELINRTTIPYVAYWSFGERLPVIEEARGTDSVRFYLETIAALVAHRLSNTELLVESSESFIAAAARAGQRRSGFSYDIFVGFTSDLAEKARELQGVLEERGFTVFNPGRPEEVGSEPDRELEYGLVQAQHAVFLIGREYSGWVDSGLRRFAKQTLDEDTDRLVLPISFDSRRSQTLPAIFQRSQVFVPEDVLPEALADKIIEEIKSSAGYISADSATSPQLKLALGQLGDSDPLAREAAVNIVSRLGNDQANLRLGDLLGDESRRVRDVAREALLRRFGHDPTRPGEIDRGVVNLLTGSLTRHENSIVRSEAAKLMGPLGDSRMLSALVILLRDDVAGVRENAALALGKLGDPVAIDWLLARLADDNRTVASAAAYALVQIGDERAIVGLLRRLQNENQEHIRGTIVEALARSEDQRVAEFALVNLANRAIREEAVEILVGLGASRSVPGLLSRLEDEAENEDVRRAALNALARIRDEKALEGILSLLEDSDPRFRSAPIEALAIIDDERALKAILSLLGDRNPGVRVAVVQALARIGGERALAGTVSRLADRDPDVRVATVRAMARFGGEAVFDAVLSMIDDSHVAVRCAVAETIAGKLEDSELSRFLSRDFDDMQPWVDPQQPIDEHHLETLSKRARIPVTEIRSGYEALNERLAGKLRLAWMTKEDSDGDH